MLRLLLVSALATAPAVGPPAPPPAATPVTPTGRVADVETLTLPAAIAELEANNPDLESASAAIDDADGVARTALAALLPVVAVSGSYIRNNEEAVIDMGAIFEEIGNALMVDINAPAGKTVIQPLQRLSASGQVVVPLFVAHAYWDVRAARASVRAREVSRDAQLARLRGGLVRAAWLAGAAESFVGVAERSMENSEKHLQSARNLFEAGQLDRLAVSQAEVQVLRRQTTLAEAHSQLHRTQLAMGVLIGREHPVRIELPEATGLPRAPADLDGAVRDAWATRPELRAASIGERAARDRITSAKLRAVPGLTGSFVANASDVDYPTGLNYGWQAGVTLSWTLYDGGARYGARRRAEAALRQARADHRRAQLQVSQEVRDAARELELAHERVALADREVEVAAAALATAERSFESGQASSLDVLDALDAEFQAGLRREESHARVAAAAADLETAMGRG